MDSMLDGLMATSTPLSRDATAGVDAMDRLASTLVRRVCNRHNCRNAGVGKPLDVSAASPCRHRNHRRDVENARLMMDALDLRGGIADPDDYQVPSDLVTFNKREGADFLDWGKNS